MPNGDGSFGSRGEVEHTRTNIETQVRIPMMLLARGFMLTSAIIVGAVAVGMLLWWWLYDGPFLRWYRYTFWDRDLAPCWAMLALRFLGRNWPLVGIAEIVAFGVWARFFLHNYVRPKILNPNWPPPSAQADPLVAGAASWYDWPTYEDEDPEPPEPQERWLRIVHENDGQQATDIPDTIYPRIPEPKRDKNDGLAGLCRGILNDTAALSWDGGEGRHGVGMFGYTQVQYRKQLRQALQAAHYGKMKGAEGFEWNGAGYAFMANLVEHDLGIECVPAEYLNYLPRGRLVGSSVGGNGPNGGNGPSVDTAGDRGGQ